MRVGQKTISESKRNQTSPSSWVWNFGFELPKQPFWLLLISILICLPYSESLGQTQSSAAEQTSTTEQEKLISSKKQAKKIASQSSDQKKTDSKTEKQNDSGSKEKANKKENKNTAGKQTKGDKNNARQVKDSRLERNLLFDPTKATKKKKPAAPRKPVSIDFSVNGTKELTFDNMIFHIKPDEPFQIKQLTRDLIKLRKHKIRIRGYIQPGFKQHNIRKFILVRDNQDCCFGPGAALYDCMIVTLAKGQSTSFSVRPITVEGTFFLKPFRGFGNKVEAILQLKDAKVK